MALDGAFLRHLAREIDEAAAGSKVDRICQPNRDELVLFLRSRTGNRRLLLSARANSARVQFTDEVPENPKEPPMLCMLLRKRLAGARLLSARQPELERVLFLDFSAVGELGDETRLTFAVEVMGKYSNIILVDEEGKIVDSLKRVDASMSSERLVLPGIAYRLPPPQDKLSLLSADREQILARLRGAETAAPLAKALLASIQGVSPVVCRELQYFTGRGADLRVGEMTQAHWERLGFVLEQTANTIRNAEGKPYMAADASEKPLDFSFLPMRQYGTAAIVHQAESFSRLLEEFYGRRDRAERMRVRSQDILRVLTTASERLSRKINLQRADLEKCAKREELRVSGDLISAAIPMLKRGQSSARLQNFYEESLPEVTVRLNPMLTPAQNAQKYYKDYRRAKTAEEMLTVQIAQAQKELAYLDTVFEELSRAQTERDLSEIREELAGQGYFREPKGKQKRNAAQAPLKYVSSDGFPIYVGRNNRQNDQLTLKQAKKEDIWFHTKNIPGSHVILVTEGREPTQEALAQAAVLAAFHSRGRDSSSVAVDYTKVRHVSKPQGAKPGMVIYVANKTMYAQPDEQAVQKLIAK